RYLLGIMNSDAFTLAVRPLQARGEHNPRHFHKFIFELSFPEFDLKDSLHQAIVSTAAECEVLAKSVQLPSASFQSQRRTVRRELESTGLASSLDELVIQLLSI